MKYLTNKKNKRYLKKKQYKYDVIIKKKRINEEGAERRIWNVGAAPPEVVLVVVVVVVFLKKLCSSARAITFRWQPRTIKYGDNNGSSTKIEKKDEKNADITRCRWESASTCFTCFRAMGAPVTLGSALPAEYTVDFL